MTIAIVKPSINSDMGSLDRYRFLKKKKCINQKPKQAAAVIFANCIDNRAGCITSPGRINNTTVKITGPVMPHKKYANKSIKTIGMIGPTQTLVFNIANNMNIELKIAAMFVHLRVGSVEVECTEGVSIDSWCVPILMQTRLWLSRPN
jgi:ribosome maturation protein Sdo1